MNHQALAYSCAASFVLSLAWAFSVPDVSVERSFTKLGSLKIVL